MSSPCTVATMCPPLMQPCHTHGHEIPRVNLRSLTVDASYSSQFCAASRVPHKLYCNSPHMCSSPAWLSSGGNATNNSSSCWSVEVRPSHVYQCHHLSSTFTRGALRQHHFQRLQPASMGTALASRVSCIPSRPSSRARWPSLVVPCQSPPILS